MITSEKFGFGDGGERVAITDFDFSAVDGGDGDKDKASEDDLEQQEAIRLAMHKAMIQTLQFICEGNPTAQEAGRRAIIRLHRLRPQKTQAELAAQLGMTAGRLSQILNSQN